MMTTKISHNDLQIISSCLTSIKDDEFTQLLSEFLKDKKDDYYFSGREPIDAKNLEISITQLERIISYVDSRQYDSIHKNLNFVYQSAIGSFQKLVFLYGRTRIE